MDSTIEIKSLASLSFEEIASAFLSAFRDYNVSFTHDQLHDMFTRRGADFNLSFGAFHRDRLVSFIINGIGSYRNAMSAYDTGTGTVPDYRGRGLTDRIFDASLQHLRRASISRYVLEVLQDNTPAVKIYSRLGFEIDRSLNCYTSAGNTIRSERLPDVEIKEIDVDTISACTTFEDFSPTWQNSTESIKRAGNNMTCLAAIIDDRIVGYGVTEAAYGDITLLAVAPDWRRRGIGSLLLKQLADRSATGSCKVINVDASDRAMNSFLASAGITLSCTQYEMSRAI